jgi:hypothetical protein
MVQRVRNHGSRLSRPTAALRAAVGYSAGMTARYVRINVRRQGRKREARDDQAYVFGTGTMPFLRTTGAASGSEMNFTNALAASGCFVIVVIPVR